MATLIRHISGALVLTASGLLQACAQAPVESGAMEPASSATGAAVASSAQAQRPVPELNLNLPEERKDCRCVAETTEEPRDTTFLERGYSALARGDHIEAVKYFQRYQRLESSPEADWEAGIGIAYVSMLPDSPFFDPEAARKSWRSLSKQLDGLKVHENSLLMRDALENFLVLDQHITGLEAENATLEQDLAKREEALKRLRELTLGQRGARQ